MFFTLLALLVLHSFARPYRHFLYNVLDMLFLTTLVAIASLQDAATLYSLEAFPDFDRRLAPYRLATAALTFVPAATVALQLCLLGVAALRTKTNTKGGDGVWKEDVRLTVETLPCEEWEVAAGFEDKDAVMC